MAHIIKYKVKDMVKVEKISQQQAQTQLQLLNAIAMMIILKVRSKALQVNDIMIKHLPYLCNLAMVLTLQAYLVLVALILQMAAIGFDDSLPTAAGRRKC